MMAKSQSKSKENLPYPRNMVQEYLEVCQLLKRYEKSLIKRFAPPLLETRDKFIRLGKAFLDDEIEPYAALCFQGAAKCENIYGCYPAEWDWWLQAAAAFERAYFKRIEMGFKPDFHEHLEGALRCYNEVLTSPHLADDSPIRAGTILALKRISPRTEERCTVDTPAFRYRDLTRCAEAMMKEGDYHGALINYTEIYEDIIERKKLHLYKHLLEENEVNRILLLLYIQPAPGNQRAANMKLWNCYQFCKDTDPLTMVAQSNVNTELHMMLREFVQSVVLQHRPTLVAVFNDLGRSWFLSEMQLLMVRKIYEKYEVDCLFQCDCDEQAKPSEEEKVPEKVSEDELTFEKFWNFLVEAGDAEPLDTSTQKKRDHL